MLFNLLAVTTILSLAFTGCSKGNDSGSAGDVQNAAKSDSSAKKFKIVVYKNGNGQGRQPADKDPILDVLNKELNIDLELNIIESEYESKLNLLAASGALPDIMETTQKQFDSFSSQGLLLDLTSYIDKMPNFLKVYPTYKTDKNLQVSGKLYFLHGVRPNKELVKAYTSLWVRKDWLDKLGLAVPKTLDDIYNVSVAFAKKDPDGNGKNDTYGFTGMGGVIAGANDPFQAFYGAYGTGMRGSYLLKNNKVVYSTTETAFRDSMEFIKKLIDSGSVDPDIMVIKSFDQVREKAYKNTVGMMYFTWAEFVKPPYDEKLKSLTPDANWIQVDPPAGPGGKWNGTYTISGPVSKGTVVSAKLKDDPEKLDRVLKYADYIVDGEGSNLVCYGIKDKHYKVENGKIVSLPTVAEVSYSWQHQVMGRKEAEYLAVKYPTNENHIKFAAEQPYIDRYNNFLKIPDGLNSADKDRYELEEMTKFIFGKRPLSEFDKFVSTLNTTYQLPKYIESAEKYLKESGIIK